MRELPKVGDDVTFDDPWFCAGEGVVVGTMDKPHLAVNLTITKVTTPNYSNWVGKTVWILTWLVKVVDDE